MAYKKKRKDCEICGEAYLPKAKERYCRKCIKIIMDVLSGREFPQEVIDEVFGKGDLK